jgi:hypothetical protein
MKTEKKDTLVSRREFLSGLKKWSKVVIAAAALAAVGSKANAGAWVNRRGSWANGGGGGWVNRHGGGSWVNRGGGGWANRRGGGGWLNGR